MKEIGYKIKAIWSKLFILVFEAFFWHSSMNPSIPPAIAIVFWSCFPGLYKLSWFLAAKYDTIASVWFPSLSKTIVYSTNATNTSPMHMKRKRSTAFKPLDIGASVFTPINMLMRTRNTVTSRPILPATTWGFIMNDAHETMTSNVDVRYTWKKNLNSCAF